jgi:hypothetical protein
VTSLDGDVHRPTQRIPDSSRLVSGSKGIGYVPIAELVEHKIRAEYFAVRLTKFVNDSLSKFANPHLSLPPVDAAQGGTTTVLPTDH